MSGYCVGARARSPRRHVEGWPRAAGHANATTVTVRRARRVTVTVTVTVRRARRVAGTDRMVTGTDRMVTGTDRMRVMVTGPVTGPVTVTDRMRVMVTGTVTGTVIV